MTTTETKRRGFVHSALFYHSEQEYLDFVVRFVADGFAVDEPVMVAIPGDKLTWLRAALLDARAGSDAELNLVDITEAARNPGRFLALKRDFVDKYPGQRVRIVSQLVWPGRTRDECVACIEHEALVNGALRHEDVMGLCLYDAQRLDEEVLNGARSTHPLLWKSGSAYRSSDYAPEDALARCNQPLPQNPGAVTYMVRSGADLRPARSFAVDYAGWVGLSDDGIEDLQLIATELATNSLQYTGGACQLAFWQDDGHVVCEARDGGRFDNPLIGHHPPEPHAAASRGLFLVNAMADLVRMHTTPSGTTIQAYLPLHPLPGATG
ncbi:anti-sigma regulatory factor [Mycobacterium kubicae]|uniref:Anti-sigma regulatory factor n=3 Tax=Mycobacterium kubicae TaxID=120959 RepID=A0AAX1JD02_9MYCO|nr:sensor histidine kinase [Mycobacterium kubicae]MCV7098371.1 sensor histidine kinase [Mycobacterium kubicae]ORW02191.1 regulator of Sig8 [Mycobacterium kubicae]QNI06190.1 sensor histidine kinase [Mycobacterium kubicae]QNI11215.1 sensor histidine kinase [Mycobacterium kubicae]QPI39429.1 sensor histidine kinase [Mycobacterium kubicae]